MVQVDVLMGYSFLITVITWQDLDKNGDGIIQKLMIWISRTIYDLSNRTNLSTIFKIWSQNLYIRLRVVRYILSQQTTYSLLYLEDLWHEHIEIDTDDADKRKTLPVFWSWKCNESFVVMRNSFSENWSYWTRLWPQTRKR